MLSEIRIYRDWPVVAGFVQVPPNGESDKTRVTPAEALAAIAGSELVFMPSGSGQLTGSAFGGQQFIRLPGLAPDEWYDTNPVDDLANS